MNSDDLVNLWSDPHRAASAAAAIRDAAFGARIVIREAPELKSPPRDWPHGDEVEPGECVVVSVPATTQGREAFARWLCEVSLPAGCSVAPCSRDSAGLHPLWCIAVARIALPPSVRIEARHDVLGIRLAQLAFGFGADTCTGPLASGRKLPIAGLPRPDENTTAGLAALIRHTGCEPVIESPKLENTP